MRNVAIQLLADKLVDDFYRQQPEFKTVRSECTDILSRLREIVPPEKFEIVHLLEKEYTEESEREIREFAVFVARTVFGIIEKVVCCRVTT
ncbi:hypothetical protein [Effusibacillus consociatus]|uniref:Competence protein ComFB n=1 Tax=Effusibacillus consociatus TaxID=1117041 RepID=A0ABV9QB90_9BACL